MDGGLRRKPLVAGNWKMHGLRNALTELADLAKGYDPALRFRVDLLVCPPATLLYQAAAALFLGRIALGGQTCHADAQGAHTGEMSAEMLADAGASFVIVGHSERRQDQGETDAKVKAQARAALRAGLTPIVCVGETRDERDAGQAQSVVARQLAGAIPSEAGPLVVAYEPVWAIGTGLTPKASDVASMHGFIRAELARSAGAARAEATHILYGGSVKPANAAELLLVPDVDGALVGGASLKAADFLGIAEVYRNEGQR